MSRPISRQQAAAAAARQQAAAAAMSGAVDLSVLKDRAEAQQRAAQRPAGAPAGAAPAGGAPSSGAVLDVTEATFQNDVLERSLQQLVL
ncbi:MAG: co-chaperone YbbN, partial [Gordonia sp. (in: high G+C Gram-positive bacteria)]